MSRSTSGVRIQRVRGDEDRVSAVALVADTGEDEIVGDEHDEGVASASAGPDDVAESEAAPAEDDVVAEGEPEPEG